MATKLIGAPNVRDDPPVANDYGMVVRPIGGGPGGATEVIPVPTDGTITSVAANAASVLLLAANANRAGFTVRNTSATAVLYLLANTTGGPASTSNHTVALYPGSYYEDPYRYIGDVFGIWATVILPGDIAMITEFVPSP